MSEATPNFDAGDSPGGRINALAIPIADVAWILSAAGGQQTLQWGDGNFRIESFDADNARPDNLLVANDPRKLKSGRAVATGNGRPISY